MGADSKPPEGASASPGTTRPDEGRSARERFRFVAAPLRFAKRQFDAEVRRYTQADGLAATPDGRTGDAARDGTEASSAPDLLACLNDAARQTNTIFAIYMSVLAYALLALARVKDADFFGYVGTIKLPVLDVDVSPGVFFVLTPVLVVGVTWYLHVYLGQVKRLWRRLKLHARRQGRDVDPDRASTWLGALSEQQGPVGRMVRVIFAGFVYVLPPVTVGLYAARLIRFRSSISKWVYMGAPPSWTAVGLLALATAALAFVWFVARRTLDHRLGLSVEASRAIKVGRLLALALLVAVAGAMLTQTLWLPRWEVGANLPRARVSTPNAEGETSPLGADLRSVDLDWANLEGAYLEDAKLFCGTFRSANLRLANLHGAIVGGVCDRTHAGTDLRDAKLPEANLRDAFLENVRMAGATLTKAELVKARAGSADLSGVKGAGAEWCGADLSHAVLAGAHFEGAHFEGADLSYSDLRDAHFDGAYFDTAKLVGANLEGADLSGAHLVGADLEGADLERAILRNADLGAAVMRRARLHGAVLADARVEGADLTDASMEGVDFSWNKNDRVCWSGGTMPAPASYYAKDDCPVARCDLLADPRNLSDKVRLLSNESAAEASPFYLATCTTERSYAKVRISVTDTNKGEVKLDPTVVDVTVKGPVRDLGLFDGHLLRVSVGLGTGFSLRCLAQTFRSAGSAVTGKSSAACTLKIKLLKSMVDNVPDEATVVGLSVDEITIERAKRLTDPLLKPRPVVPAKPARPIGRGQQP